MPVHDWTRVPPNVFPHFHPAWLTAISNALNRGVLPDDHYAALEQVSGDVVPDIVTLRTEPASWPRNNGAIAGALAVAEHPPHVEFVAESESFLGRQKRITIRHPLGEIVAIIELVSPDNKRTVKSLERFQAKVLGALKQGQHVLVLDILPPGGHDPNGIHAAIWDDVSDRHFTAPAERPLTLASYESDVPPTAYVQPLAVGQELPPMPIFLAPGWYIDVPLATTYEEAWLGTPRPWQAMLVG